MVGINIENRMGILVSNAMNMTMTPIIAMQIPIKITVCSGYLFVNFAPIKEPSINPINVFHLNCHQLAAAKST